jgi:hypothetical protein
MDLCFLVSNGKKTNSLHIVKTPEGTACIVENKLHFGSYSEAVNR